MSEREPSEEYELFRLESMCDETMRCEFDPKCGAYGHCIVADLARDR